MGLDMYLNASIYLWGDDERTKKIAELFPELSDEKEEEIAYKPRIEKMNAEIGYWRKSYPIHMWFVKHIQGGVDNCGEYELTKEGIKKLLTDIDEVLADREKAHVLLPNPESNPPYFVFDYGEGYSKELEYTKKIVKKALRLYEKGWEIFYTSSW